MEIVSQSLVLNQVQQAALAAAPTPTQSVDITAQAEQFQQMVSSAGNGAPVQLNAVPDVQNEGIAPISGENIGDTILNGIQRLGENYQQKLAQVGSTIDGYHGDPIDTQGLMQVQVEVLAMSMQQDLMTRIADRTSQGIQTLFKNQ